MSISVPCALRSAPLLCDFTTLRLPDYTPRMSQPDARPSIYAGIDEAGRGCVIGPLVIAIVRADEKDRRWFAERRVRDSKLIAPRERDDLAQRIRERCWHRIIAAEPQEIDGALADPLRSLNTLEQELMVVLIREFQKEHADFSARILSDAISRHPDGHARRLEEGSLRLPHHIILARIRADRDDRTVGAASILAKTERERRIAKLKQEIGIDFGSGYPSDPKTISTLPSFPKNAPFVRWSWKTTGP